MLTPLCFLQGNKTLAYYLTHCPGSTMVAG